MPELKLPRPKVVLLDIEGTICPISFVKDVLFPYALRALPQIASSQWNTPTFQNYVSAFPDPAARASPAALVECVEQLTRDDVKVSHLKNLQGYLWRTGYESHEFSSPLFPDVVPALRSWHAGSDNKTNNKSDTPSITLAIYSSGSIAAQKLLLQYVSTSPTSPTPTTTDIRPLFNPNYFDTTNAGPKLASASYIKIAETMGVEPGEVVFFSDHVGETGAARGAGMQGVVVTRVGNKALSEEEEREWQERIVEGLGEVVWV